MALTREDKVWLTRLAALIVSAVNEIICGQFKTQIAIDRVQDILSYGLDDKSDYLR